MDQILKNIVNPDWWLSVVIIAFLINLGSSYFKPWLDDRLARFSTDRKRASEERKQRFEKAVKRFWADGSAVVDAKLDRINYYLRAVFIVAVALVINGIGYSIYDAFFDIYSRVFLLFLNAVSFGSGVFALIFALSDLNKAREINKQLEEHYKSVRENKILNLAEKREHILQDLNGANVLSQTTYGIENLNLLPNYGEADLKKIDEDIADEIGQVRPDIADLVKRKIEDQNKSFKLNSNK